MHVNSLRARALLLTAMVAVALLAWKRPALLAYFAANACGDSARLSWEPPAPRQGSLFRVYAEGVPPTSRLDGSAAGEPLHFAPLDGDTARLMSHAALPIDGARTLTILVRCVSDHRTDSLSATLEAAIADYPLERLTVAPQFGRPPDSAVLARTRRESQRAVDVAVAAHRTPKLWRGEFVWPRDSRITSVFGSGREFNGTVTSRHMGTDFAGASGAPVHATNRGVVRIVDEFYYGGNVIYLDHGAGLSTAYLHLSEQLVAVGDTVEAGQLIGRVGATGRVTGPHLHLIVRYGDVTVDPMSLLEKTRG